jgi:exopolysaccharide biosynthesis protein
LKKILTIGAQFLLINIIVFILTSPWIVLHGPFTNLRNTVVGAVSTSMHSYWLGYFMSDEQVNKLVVSAQNTTNSTSGDIVTDFQNSHSNEIKLTDISSNRFKGYMLEISDPTRVKIGLAETVGQKGQTTSEIAGQYGAVAAVNGGGFDDDNGTGNGRLPFGVVINNGFFKYGGSFTAPVPLIGINNQGVLISGRYTSKQISAMQITEGISFYPTLILNGKKQITSGDGGWGIGPRTAIGQKADGHILLLVIDGRQPQHSLGATLVDVQNILFENGAVTAANLDGGSSTTMYFQGKVINKPCDLLGERSIPTAILVI